MEFFERVNQILEMADSKVQIEDYFLISDESTIGDEGPLENFTDVKRNSRLHLYMKMLREAGWVIVSGNLYVSETLDLEVEEWEYADWELYPYFAKLSKADRREKAEQLKKRGQGMFVTIAKALENEIQLAYQES